MTMSLVMPDHINERSANQDTITIMKTAPTNTETLKPLGNLSRFPREIRDEIYRHVLSNTYKAFYSSSIFRPTFNYHPEFSERLYNKRESNMSILRLSKAIKDEVMPLFYSEKTFCFYYSPPYEEGTPLHPKTDITVRLMNVTLFYEANDYDRDHETLTHYFARVGPLQFFRGATIVRHSIIVELHLREWSGDDTVTIGSPLFRGLEQLTGFKTVTITFAVKEWMDTEQWEKLYAGFEPLLSAMSKVLEPTLGSCSATSELVSREGGCPGEDTVSWFSLRGITFHPRDHLASISKAKKDTMNMEQSMNSMRIN